MLFNLLTYVCVYLKGPAPRLRMWPTPPPVTNQRQTLQVNLARQAANAQSPQMTPLLPARTRLSLMEEKIH